MPYYVVKTLQSWYARILTGADHGGPGANVRRPYRLTPGHLFIPYEVGPVICVDSADKGYFQSLKQRRVEMGDDQYLV